MNKTFQTNKKPFILAIEFESNQPVQIKIEAEDKLKPNTFYCKKKVSIDGVNKFKIRFAKTPVNLFFTIYPASYETYSDYLKFGKSQPKKFKITKTEIMPMETGSKISRFYQSFAEDAIIIK